MTEKQKKEFISKILEHRKQQREQMYELMILPFDKIIKHCEEGKKGKISLKVFIEGNKIFSKSLEKTFDGFLNKGGDKL